MKFVNPNRALLRQLLVAANFSISPNEITREVNTLLDLLIYLEATHILELEGVKINFNIESAAASRQYFRLMEKFLSPGTLKLQVIDKLTTHYKWVEDYCAKERFVPTRIDSWVSFVGDEYAVFVAENTNLSDEEVCHIFCRVNEDYKKKLLDLFPNNKWIIREIALRPRTYPLLFLQITQTIDDFEKFAENVSYNDLTESELDRLLKYLSKIKYCNTFCKFLANKYPKFIYHEVFERYAEALCYKICSTTDHNAHIRHLSLIDREELKLELLELYLKDQYLVYFIDKLFATFSAATCTKTAEYLISREEYQHIHHLPHFPREELPKLMQLFTDLPQVTQKFVLALSYTPPPTSELLHRAMRVNSPQSVISIIQAKYVPNEAKAYEEVVDWAMKNSHCTVLVELLDIKKICKHINSLKKPTG